MEETINVMGDENAQGAIVAKPDERITIPRLTKYERTRIIGVRKEQIAKGAAPMVDISEMKTLDEIVEKELLERKLPLKIRRPLPNGKVEIWSLKELIY